MKTKKAVIASHADVAYTNLNNVNRNHMAMKQNLLR